jgi:hypothetical protein
VRSNTQGIINTNLETEKSLKGSVLPILERLHKEIKHKAKELASGAQKGAKEVEKLRNSTQKHIELLGQHTASFDSAGGQLNSHDDPYVVHRGVLHRLSEQVIAENNHHNDLVAVQQNFQQFEAHVIEVFQQAIEAFTQLTVGQADKNRALYSDMLSSIQNVPLDFEWANFNERCSDRLVSASDPSRSVDAIQFPNMEHGATKPLIEGSLERKSRNKLSWGYSTGYYVVTPSKYLHEFKDSDNTRNEPKPELSVYLPDAIIGAPNGDKFNIKGKDKSKTMSSRLTGTTELSFKAHTAADAQKWFQIIQNVTGATGPAATTPASAPSSPISGNDSDEKIAQDMDDKLQLNSPTATEAPASNVATIGAHQHQEQEAGVTGGGGSPTVTSSPAADKKAELA